MRKLASASRHLRSTAEPQAPRQQQQTCLKVLMLRAQCQVLGVVEESLQPKQPSWTRRCRQAFPQTLMLAALHAGTPDAEIF